MKNLFSLMLIIMLMITASMKTGRTQDSIRVQDVARAEKLIGMEFSRNQQDSMLQELNDNLKYYRELREVHLQNSISPALIFNPIPAGAYFETEQNPIIWSRSPAVKMPDNMEELAFYSIRELAELIRTGRVTSEELTRMFLSRLKEYDPQLHCIITLMEDSAMARAAKMDQEIAGGHYRGMLHGIPYGVKDLLAIEGYRTTWGAMPYKDQIIEETAVVVQKLDAAGAVPIVKLSMGALAWGDVWFGAQTRNPWDLEQGSSGSSAGSAAATAAGLVPFAIGTETWGSIVSPSTRCGTTGLRPTFGRVSRTGAMALSWSMDKIGPICRTVEDCAIVFDAMRGPDGIDPTLVDLPFNYDAEIDPGSIRLGYLKSEFEKDTVNRQFNEAALQTLEKLNFRLVPLESPDMKIYPMSFILSAEAAAAFDDLTRSGRDSLLVRQISNAWPNVFRASRFIPAVEYIQANRLRSRLIDEWHNMMKQVDVYVAPPFGENLLATNLTGHPCVVLPNGFDEEGHPVSITFTGKLYDEATVLAVARAYQQATDFHRKHPPMFEVK